MSSDKLRRRIASEAARLLYTRQAGEYHAAKLRAARQLLGGNVRADDLPTNREVLDEFNARALAHQARQDAAESADQVDDWRQRILPIDGRRPDELRFDTPIDLQAHVASEPSGTDDAERLDRFHQYQLLLAPLEQVKQNAKRHPEGDALYHSLQVFTLAREALPYDEEFLLAALLHDVGKAIDPQAPVVAGLDALAGYITPRTAWLIEHRPDAQQWREGTLGARCRRRLAAHEDYEELMLLADCDRRGRQRGAVVPDVEEALAYLRELDEM
ncbi:MAG: HD domain-containing protein [Pirellulales bacterium]|nr:HD domain-containing protein [Pirellulales bacterium]